MLATTHSALPSRLRLLVLLAIVALPAPARGYALRTSERGQVLIWSPTRVTLEVSIAGIDNVAAAYQAVQSAFLAWTATGAPLRVDFQHSAVAPTPANDGHNTLSWVGKGWKYGDEVVGMTIAWYRASSALVDETDVVLNLRDHSWTTGAPDPTRFDVQNVVTHEAGHFFGLAHEPSLPADVMYPVTPPGETQKRELKADDRAGLAALVLETNRRLGPRAQSTAASPSAISDQDAPDVAAKPGCSVGGGSPAGLAWSIVLLAGLWLGGRPRRRAGAISAMLVLLAAPAIGRASAVLPLSIEEMTVRADLVASGVVARRTAVAGDDGLIYTRVEVRSERCYLGACRDVATVTVQIPGGELGELGMAVEGAPRVHVGERVLLFAVRRGSGHALLGLGLGLFRLQGRLARRDLGGLAFLRDGRRTPAAQLGVVELEAAIARGLRARPAPLPGPAAR